MRGRYVLVGIGEVLWDVLPDGKQLGGAPANVAYHAHALGADGYVVSCVGKDDLGHALIRQIEALGLNCSAISVDPDHPTGTVEVKLDSQGKPVYVIHEDVAWDYIPLFRPVLELGKKTDAVCFGSLCQRSPMSRNTIRAFIGSTSKACLRMFDVNLRQSFYDAGIIDDLLTLSNVLKISDEELPVVTGLLSIRGDESAVLGELLERYHLRLIALTRGANGSVLVTPDGVFSHPGVRVEVTDTVGAGDAFAAAVVMGMLSGLGFEQVNDLANRLAGIVCSRPGAMPEIPESFAQMFAQSAPVHPGTASV